MPAHHDVHPADVNAKRLGAVLALAHERELRDFASFLLLEQLGPRTLQSLALVAEERRISPALGGRTVLDDQRVRGPKSRPRTQQLDLFAK